MSTRPRATEVDAYIFIKENLANLGWDTRNPSRNPQGQVYTQNECLGHPEVARFLRLDRPENIVKITESIFWVLEAKREHRQLDQALEQAINYAERINQSTNISAKFISGVAGNEDDSYLIKSKYFTGYEWLPIKINEREISGLLTPDQTLEDFDFLCFSGGVLVFR